MEIIHLRAEKLHGLDGRLWLERFYNQEMSYLEDFGGLGNNPRYSIDRISQKVSAGRILLI
jgi:hypothetical protein